jgi:catechol 2,3-dioxygenase-like lactoylglutathione lyase family enzyme
MTETNCVTLCPGLPAIPQIDQVCILVDDMDEAIEEYSRLLPISQWRGYRYGPETIPELYYRGRKAEFWIWLVLSDSTPQVELIQSLSGPSIYTEWLEVHGPGFHHVGTFTKALAEDTAALEARGFTVSQWGRGYGVDGDGGFAYFDTADRLGLNWELIEVPARRRTPDQVWTVER